MNTKLLILFSLLVCIPLMMVSGFSIRLMQDQHGIDHMREQALIAQQLSAIDDIIQARMRGHERALLSEKISDLNPWVLRQLVSRHASIVQLMVLDAAGHRRFPPSSDLSQAEVDFLQRTALLRQDMGEHWVARLPSEPRTPRQRAKKPSMEGVDELGWRVWYWAEGIHVLYVWQDERGYRFVAEVSRIKLLSDIVAALPITNDPNYAITMRDSTHKIVYQWGGYRFEPDKPVREQALSYPLSAWSLAYYQPVQRANPLWVLSPLMMSLVFGSALVIALAIVFYRESVREFRDAQQRVTFVNQVSHELKTPLTNIRMYAELLEAHLSDDAHAQRQKLQVIIAEAQRLSRMISNVLTFARQARKTLRYQPGAWVLDEVVNAVVQQFELAFQAKGIHVQCVLNTAHTVTFDRDIVEQILGNLLNNVEKYAPNSGLVTVTTEHQNTHLILTVTDQGPGINKAMRSRLFDPFIRGDDGLTEGVSGTGIGLSIARDLARLHGGELCLLNNGQKGAVFQLQIMCEGVA